MLSQEEKAKRFDDIQAWYWWLEERVKNSGGKTIPKPHLKTFLRGIKDHLDPYKEEDKS